MQEAPSLAVNVMMIMRNKESAMAECHSCKHFYITWDKNAPRGCRGFDFKTDGNPSEVIYRNTGVACQLYSPKAQAKTTTKKATARRKR